MALTTVILRWRGPYSRAQVKESGEGNGLYLLVGKRPKFRDENQIQYVGMTTRLYDERFKDNDHPVKIKKVRPDTLSIWLGDVIYPSEFEKTHLLIAERCFAYVWKPNLNIDGKYHPPQPICFISQWYHPDGEPRLRRPVIAKGMEDVLWWDGELWRTGCFKIWPS